VTGRRRRRSKQLLDDLNETTGYCKFTYETPDRRMWRSWWGTAIWTSSDRDSSMSAWVKLTNQDTVV